MREDGHKADPKVLQVPAIGPTESYLLDPNKRMKLPLSALADETCFYDGGYIRYNGGLD